MNAKIELAEAERRTLEELSRNHPLRDFRLRALGVLALGKGHGLKLVSDILGVTAQSVGNWAKGWLMGLLNGHKGGRPPKLTPAMLDTAEAAARAEARGLREIARRVKEAHPEAPPFSLDRLAAGLKARGLSWKRTRLSLKKKRCPERFEAARDDLKRCQAAARGGGARRPDRAVLPGRMRLRQHPERAAVLVPQGSAPRGRGRGFAEAGQRGRRPGLRHRPALA